MSIEVELSHKKARGKKKILKGIFLMLLGGGILLEEFNLHLGLLLPVPYAVLAMGAVLLLVGIIMIPAGMLQWWANK